MGGGEGSLWLCTLWGLRLTQGIAESSFQPEDCGPLCIHWLPCEGSTTVIKGYSASWDSVVPLKVGVLCNYTARKGSHSQ